MDDKFSTIAEMKKAAADYANHCTAENYSAIERALFWAHISQALAAERQAAALERIAAVLESTRGMYGGVPFIRTSDSLGDDAPQMGD